MADPTDRVIRRFRLDDLCKYIDLYHGCFAIGFKAQSDRERERTRRGEAAHAHLSQRLSRTITSDESGGKSTWSVLSSLIPLSLLDAAVQEFTSSMRFVHCEAAFYLSEAGRTKFGDDHMISITAQQKAPVHMYARRFNHDYEWLNVAADCNQLRAIVGYCHQLQGQKFQYGAMARCLTTPGPDTRQRWFCSYMCATMLEFLDVPDGHLNRPNTLSIDDLYYIVSEREYRPAGDYSRPAAHLKKIYEKLQLQ